jgi:hypothetical protein
MTYKRNYISKKNKLVPGRPQIAENNPSKERKIRHIRMSDDEWKFATENARLCHKHTSTYIREIATGYRPMTPDPQLKIQLAKSRTDIIRLSKKLAGLSDENRKLVMGELEYQIQWFNAVQIILNFIDDLRRRI